MSNRKDSRNDSDVLSRLGSMTRSTPARPAVQVQRCALTVGGRRRSFLTVRGHVRAARPALLVMLHGTLQTASTIRAFAGYSFDNSAVGGHVVVIYPDAIGREWNGARKAVMLSKRTKSIDDVGFVRAMIEHAIGTEHVDPARVFVAGFSLGGQMTIRLIHEIPEMLAGAAVLGATVPAPENLNIDRDAHLGMPVLTIHGTADPVAPYQGGAVDWHGHFSKGVHLSAADTARYFGARNGITTEPVVTALAHRPDHGKATSVTRYDYTAPGAPPVRFYTVHGGGHVLPNPTHTPAQRFWGPSTRDICAADVIAEFFSLRITSTDEGAS
jgi:polyhydroxybutyrate depolymerase